MAHLFFGSSLSRCSPGRHALLVNGLEALDCLGRTEYEPSTHIMNAGGRNKDGDGVILPTGHGSDEVHSLRSDDVTGNGEDSLRPGNGLPDDTDTTTDCSLVDEERYPRPSQESEAVAADRWCHLPENVQNSKRLLNNDISETSLATMATRQSGPGNDSASSDTGSTSELAPSCGNPLPSPPHGCSRLLCQSTTTG